MGDYVAHPTVCATKGSVQSWYPNVDFVVKKVGGAIGIIFSILQHNTHFFIGLVLIQLGDRPINLFGYSGNHLRTAIITLLKMHHKMLAFHSVPIQMIIGIIVVHRVSLSE